MKFYKLKNNVLKNETILFLVGIMISFFFSFLMFKGLSLKDADIKAHIITATDLNELNVGLYSIYYMLIRYMTFGEKTFENITVTALIFLSTCVALKWAFSYFIMLECKINDRFSFLLATCLIFLMPPYNFFNKAIYLGNLTPNVWHNSTIIVSLPFSVLMIFLAVNLLYNFNEKKLIIFTLVSIVSSLLKVSFSVVFIPCYFLMVLNEFFKKKINTKTFIKFIICFFLMGVLVLIQYFSTMGGEGLSFAPFWTWKLYTNNIAYSLFISLFFPVICIVLNWESFLKNKYLILSMMVTVLSILIFMFLKENGERATHGNFFWSIVPSLYCVFLFSFKILNETTNKIKIICFCSFLPYLYYGLIYYYLMLYTPMPY